MRSRPALLLLAALALTPAACGAEPSSAEQFEGDARAVAETIEDVQRAAERDEADRICRDFLSEDLADAVAAGGESCQEEMEKAISDADVFDLEVEEVEVSGTTATARVRGAGEPNDSVAEFELVRGGRPARWRVDSFGEAS